MVLATHGVHGVAAECRRLCGGAGGRDGTNARTLASVAQRLGLAARVISVAPDAVRELALPAIVHWESRHFIVVARVARRHVEVVDPALGRRRLSHAEFAAGFGGVAIDLTPTASIVRQPRDPVPLWLRYLAAMFQDRSAQGTLLQVIIASLLLQAGGLAVPVFTKLVVDDLAPTSSALSLSIVAVAMAAVVISKTVVTFVRSLVLIRLQSRLDARLTAGFLDHLLRLPYTFFRGRTSGDLLMRLSSNTMIREALTTQLLALLLDGPFALLYLGVLAVIAPSFALLAVGLATLQAVLVLLSLRPLHDVGQRSLAAKSDEQSCLVELMKGIAHVKASGAEDFAFQRWAELFRRQLGVYVERSHLTAKVELAIGLVRAASPLALLWYGAWLVATGSLALGTMLALTALAASFLTPFMTLVQSSQQLQVLEAYVERLADVLHASPEPRATSATSLAVRQPARRLSGAIDVRGLTYRFTPDAAAVVDDVSFSVRPGESLGIVGATGSGKSTLLFLLLGLYEPTDGEIRYDGVSLTELDPREVRQQCGVVLQDVSLFAGSMHANIALNAASASRENVVRAAGLAGLHDDILRMPMGYETRLAEGGANLSGGQRQRVAIARALVNTPPILMLDEASSHLDVASESQLIRHLEKLECTRIVIAHRLTAVRSATEILVMQSGRVVERGTHAALMTLDGSYARLAIHQGPALRSGNGVASDGLPRAPGVNAGV